MTPFLSDFILSLEFFLKNPFSKELWIAIWQFMPFVLTLEVPVYFLIFLGIAKYVLSNVDAPSGKAHGTALPVSCIVPGYGEGLLIQKTILTLAEQLYAGKIQIIVVVDGASANKKTYEAATSLISRVNEMPQRSLLVIPKWKRGGRVSTLNLGMHFVSSDIVVVLDGDTSADNDMIQNVVRHFKDPSIAAVSGSLRVRNVKGSLLTRLQAIEYLITIHATRTALSSFNLVNNISGAFGVFRRDILDALVGWDTGSAEDLDLTLRIKNYFGRYKGLRILFDPQAVALTDVPETFGGFLKQRLRWDGDLPYLYFKKHWRSLNPRIIGFKNFIVLVWTGILFQVVMPFVIISYTLYLFVTYPISLVLSVLFVIYLFYLAITLFFFIVAVVFLSERPKMDLTLFPWIFLMPLFLFLTRLNAAFAILWEMIGESHQDTSMAPWWVLRKRG